MISGKARLGKKTKDLVRFLKPGEIAIIDHEDLDEVAAQSLARTGIRAVVNASCSLSGRFPHRGPWPLLKAGIPLLDGVGKEVFETVGQGQLLTLLGEKLLADKRVVARGRLLREADLNPELIRGSSQYEAEVRYFVQNTLERAEKEAANLLKNLSFPVLERFSFKGRHALVVVRGSGYLNDLAAIKPYIREEAPLIIAVDGAADALLSMGYQPDVIIGDMDSISDRGLACGALLVVHAYINGKAPGLERVRRLGLQADVLPALGTSEDVALLLAYEKGVELIVVVGAHSNIVDFLAKGRQGMASTLLVRLKVGPILVDAKGLNRLYQSKLKGRYLAQLVGAALIPFGVVFTFSPSTLELLRLMLLHLRISLGF